MFNSICSCKFNELPDELLEEILTCVPIQDAVKTSILSRRWRNVWKKISTLYFDDKFCTPLIRSSERRLIEVIYQVLLLHDGPILNFSLELSNLKICSAIDQFLVFVSKRGIKEFSFNIPKGGTYRLPSSIFSCEQLEHLSLYNCSFRPPAGFKGFSKLVSLKLEDVSINGQLFSSLIRNCPLLETLDFDSSTIIDRLELFAPNLRKLSFYGFSKFLCFSDTPKLASVDLSNYYGGIENSECLLSGWLPRLDDLELDPPYAEVMIVHHAPEVLATYLCNLKTLRLWHFCFRTSSDVSSIVTLIRNSPKLEKLKIIAYGYSTLPDSVSVNGWDFTLHQLREVKLKRVSGSKCELQFIELLLANSPRLKKIIVKLELKNVMDKGLEFFKELSRFRRASPLAEIVFKVSDE